MNIALNLVMEEPKGYCVEISSQRDQTATPDIHYLVKMVLSVYVTTLELDAQGVWKKIISTKRDVKKLLIPTPRFLLPEHCVYDLVIGENVRLVQE